MKKITLENGKVVEISEESYKALSEGVRDWKPWRAEEGEEYWCVFANGGSCYDKELGYPRDNYRYLTGNYFKTEEEAEAYKQKQLAIGRVTHAIYELNQGWEPDWSNDEEKFYVHYDHVDKMFCSRSFYITQESLLFPYSKEQPTQEWLNKHEEDLKLIFNVK